MRLAAKPLGISKIDAAELSISLQFIPNPPVDGMKIIEMVQKHKHIKLAGQDKLRIEARSPDLAVRISTVKETLRALGGRLGRRLPRGEGFLFLFLSVGPVFCLLDPVFVSVY